MSYISYTSEIWKSGIKVTDKLRSAGFSAYFVGGCVRDLILEQEIKDIDIVTDALPDNVVKIFPNSYLIGAAFGIVNIIEDGRTFEIATFRKETGYNDGRHPSSISYAKTAKEDSNRRDFTINSLYLDSQSGEIFDFHNGLEDIKRKILRTIGNPRDRFTEDYLRMLRAIRFSTRLNFELEDELFSSIKSMAFCISDLSIERIRDELSKIFMNRNAARGLELLMDSKILKIVLPEIDAMKGIRQPVEYHPEGDVFEHTKLMLSKVIMPTEELVWSVLLHDVGKVVTFSLDERGKERFICHAEKGKEIAENILKRLKFSKQKIDNISDAVLNHMRFASVCNMRPSKYKALIAKEIFPLELELHRIDCAASNKFIDTFVFLLDKIIEQRGERRLPRALISGKDLLDIGYQESPIIGKIIMRIVELQNDGIIKSKEEAITFAKANKE